MSVPICPVHQSPMKLGNGNNYFCARKNADDSWCSSKAPGSVAPRVGAPVASAAPAANGTNVSPKILLAIAALDFAGRVYAGTGDGDNALALANHATQMPWQI